MCELGRHTVTPFICAGMWAGEENRGSRHITQCCSQNKRRVGEYPNKENGDGEIGSRLNEGMCSCGNRQNVGLRWSKGVRGRWWWEEKNIVGEKRMVRSENKHLSEWKRGERKLSMSCTGWGHELWFPWLLITAFAFCSADWPSTIF